MASSRVKGDHNRACENVSENRLEFRSTVLDRVYNLRGEKKKEGIEARNFLNLVYRYRDI